MTLESRRKKRKNMTTTNIATKLLEIQTELKAPKGQYNKFGNFNYRSAEDIIEAVKPICAKHGVLLTLRDELNHVGERYYIRAIARLTDCESAEYIETCAFAREAATKSGMDESQLTGSTSSYARKYALNGLFAIDDTKDADTDEFGAITGKGQSAKAKETTSRGGKKTSKSEPVTSGLSYREKVMIAGEERGLSAKALAEKYGLTRETTEERFKEVLKDLEGK